jgi:hypothetical protein
MRGPEFLRQRVGKLKSRMGGVIPGSHATIRGVDLHATFKDAEWMDIYMFGITGRRFSKNELALLQSIWTYTSYPDARIWNNRVAALAGSARSTGALAISAALAVSEAKIYGGGTYMPSVAFLQTSRKKILAGASIADCVAEELRARRGIAGYGRPLTSKDERIAPLMTRAHELGLDNGPHVRLAVEIDRYLVEHRLRMRANYAAIAAGLIADLELSPREFYLCVFPVFLAGMLPCYLEALEQPEGAFFPIPCDDIAYAGREKRIWGEQSEVNGTGATISYPPAGLATGE